MMRVGIVVVALTACRAPLAEGSGARFGAGSTYGPELAEIIADVEPKIIEILGTRWEREYDVTIEEHGDFNGQTRFWDRKVSISPTVSADELPLTLTHELVHVHMRGAWCDLPMILQEGVCVWVSLLALDRTDEFVGPPPERRLCIEVLTLPYSRYLHASKWRQNELEYAATWLAAKFISPRFVQAERASGDRPTARELWLRRP